MRRFFSPFLALVVGLALAHVGCEDSGSSSSTGTFDAGGTGSFDAGTTDATPPETTDASVPREDAATVDASPPDAGVDAGPPGTIPDSAKAATQVDLVGAGDKNVAADGAVDATIKARLVGPVDGLILVTTNAAGTPAGGQQWDTITGADPLPDIGSPFSSGGQTWVLGVFDANGAKLNDAEGRISLPAGVQDLTLAASDSGYFVAGQSFRLYARSGGTWTAGPVFVW